MNPPRTRGPIARIVIGLWDAVNFSRRLVFNLLFLLVLALLLAAMLGGGKLAPLAERTTLVLAPQGRLVEQFSCDPLSRAFARATDGEDCREVRLRDLLRALESARTDKRIERVVLQLDEFQPGGFASARDVAAAIAGADLVAFGEEHQTPAVHRRHHELLRELHQQRPQLVIAMEMFERDVQPLLDQYLRGEVDEQRVVGVGGDLAIERRRGAGHGQRGNGPTHTGRPEDPPVRGRGQGFSRPRSRS